MRRAFRIEETYSCQLPSASSCPENSSRWSSIESGSTSTKGVSFGKYSWTRVVSPGAESMIAAPRGVTLNSEISCVERCVAAE